jgi:putative ABC transport system substrate-binding protein
MMDRRVFMSGFTLGLLAAPLGAEAQQVGKVYRIGVVAPGVNPRSASFFQAFEQRLRELGWVDGRNLVIDFQMPKGSSDISSIAADLVGQNVDLILAGGPEASLKAARQATSTIPIVMVALNYDPVERGHVASLAHPGGNVTGVFSLAPEQGAKQLELLKEALPRVTRVGVLWDSFATDQMPILDASAPKLKVQLEKVRVRPEYDLEQAFLTLEQRRVGAVLVVGSPIFFRDQAKIAELAVRHRLPAGGFVSGVAGGLLLGYGVPASVPYRRAAAYVDTIFLSSSLASSSS